MADTHAYRKDSLHITEMPQSDGVKVVRALKEIMPSIPDTPPDKSLTSLVLFFDGSKPSGEITESNTDISTQIPGLRNDLVLEIVELRAPSNLTPKTIVGQCVLTSIRSGLVAIINLTVNTFCVLHALAERCKTVDESVLHRLGINAIKFEAEEMEDAFMRYGEKYKVAMLIQKEKKEIADGLYCLNRNLKKLGLPEVVAISRRSGFRLVVHPRNVHIYCIANISNSV